MAQLQKPFFVYHKVEFTLLSCFQFDGKLPALADTVNEFINKNSQLIINEVKPQIREEVTRLVESVMNDAFSKLPADDFLEKLPTPAASSSPSARSIPKVRSRSILFGRR